MEIVIKIPKEFEEHFNSDRFEDSLQRVRVDIHKSIIGNKFVLSGNREIETLDMLTEAFLNGIPLPEHHGRLIDADAFIDFLKNISKTQRYNEFIIDKKLTGLTVDDVFNVVCESLQNEGLAEGDSQTIIKADKEVNADDNT